MGVKNQGQPSDVNEVYGIPGHVCRSLRCVCVSTWYTARSMGLL